MSTRSIIVVTGKNRYGQGETIRLYKHCDGYPTGNLPLIAEALKRAKEQCEADRLPIDRIEKPSVEQLIGLLIGVATDTFGMGARIDCDDLESHAIYNEEFKLRHLGNQHDLEWIYIVSLDAKAVNVFGGGYTNNSPQWIYKKGLVDPLSYASQLKEEYRTSEVEKIIKAITSIKALGFLVNCRTNSSTKKTSKERRPCGT